MRWGKKRFGFAGSVRNTFSLHWLLGGRKLGDLHMHRCVASSLQLLGNH